jgi:hypothetical protein
MQPCRRSRSFVRHRSVKHQLCLLGCLLAGCSSLQPAVLQPSLEDDPGVVAGADQARPTTTDSVLRSDTVLRIGLEHLPPTDATVEDAAGNEVRVERREPVASKVQPRGERRFEPLDEPSRTPQLDNLDLEAIEDPVARETLHFVRDLVAADRQRVRREVGIPFFDFRGDDSTFGPMLTSERQLEADHEQWVQEHGTSLLQRPLRMLLRRMPFVRDVEIEIEEFRSDNVPLSEPYRQVHGDRRRLGRVSFRVDPGDFADPVEVVYIHSNLRLGTSQERGKLTFHLDLAENLQFELRARADYETNRLGMRADLVYRPAPRMSVHLALGDDMDFLSTSSLYSLFESPMDGSPGLVLYAVHTF